MKIKRLRIHYYTNEENKKNLILFLNKILIDKKYNNIKWFLKRDWKYGPNIGIYILLDKKNKKKEDEFLNNIIDKVNEFWKTTKSDEILPSILLMKQLNSLENGSLPKSSYLPVNKNYSCIIDEIVIRKNKYFSTTEEFKFFIKSKCEFNNILLKTIKKLKYLNEEEETLLFIMIFSKVAKCYPNAGLIKGSVSFKSHAIGFLGSKNKKTEILRIKFNSIYNYLNYKLTQLYKNDYKNKKYENLLNEWEFLFKNFISNIKYDSELRNYLKSNSKLSNIAKKKLTNYTDFHTRWVSNSNFNDFFYSDEFYKYRLLVNLFYSFLPNIGISPVKKHLFCYLISRSIEENSKINLSKLINL